jgi:SprT protein
MNDSILNKKVVSKELQNRVFNKVLECLDIAQRHFGEHKVPYIPSIKYETCGTTAGWAYWRRNGKSWIDINPILLNENPERVVNVTVPHEIAHIVVGDVYKDDEMSNFICKNGRRYRKVKPHGIEWQRVMRLFGLEPERCHDMNVSTIHAMRHKVTFTYKCNCDEYKVGPTVHKRITVLGRSYSCKKCKGKLVKVGD